MENVLQISEMSKAQQLTVRQAFEKERRRLLQFIENRIPRKDVAEDIMQDVFFQFVERARLPEPLEQLSSWLFAVARNKITDWFRKKKEVSEEHISFRGEESEESGLFMSDLLPEISDDPELQLVRKFLMEELLEAIDQLPSEQKEVFIWQEVEGFSFKEISANTGIPVNTLISRKRYAVLFLRKRLQHVYEEFINQ